MREATGNMWEMKADRFVVTLSEETSVDTLNEDYAIMTSGTAKQAKIKYPGIEKAIGCLFTLPTCGPGVWPIPGDMITFPVKRRDADDANLAMIQESAQQLVELTNRRGWKTVVLPRPGTGKGGLLWETVRPVLADILDDRFICVTYPARKETS